MKRILVLLCCIVLIVSIAVPASAYIITDEESQSREYFLYQDFKPLGEDADGNYIWQLTPDLSLNYYTISNYNQDPIASGYGSTITWSSYEAFWVDNWILGGSDGFHNNSYFKSTISTLGFQSNSTIKIGYELIGANVSTDHHDLWIYYFDEGVLVNTAQHSNLATTTNGRRFLIEVPMTGSHFDSFAINLQIDDIIPTVPGGLVSFALNSLAITTTGLSDGPLYEAPIIPIKPPVFEEVGELEDFEGSILDGIGGGTDAFYDVGNAAVELLTAYFPTLIALSSVFNLFVDLPWVRVVLYISLAMGLSGFFLSISSGLGYKTGRSIDAGHRRSMRAQKRR